jgi:hypothetical protein
MASVCDVKSSAVQNRDDSLISSQNAESGNCTMDTITQKSPSIGQSSKETQSEFSSPCRKRTQEAGIQTDSLDFPSFPEESFYEHSTLIPELNKV